MAASASDVLALQTQELLPSYRADQVTRVVVGGVLCRRVHGCLAVLVLKRVADDEYGGLEEMPSGSVEHGETLGEALAREFLEETGLRIRAAGPFLFDFTYRSRRGITVQLNFLVDAADDLSVRVDPAEHESYRWVPLTTLSDSGLSTNVRRGLARCLGSQGSHETWGASSA